MKRVLAGLALLSIFVPAAQAHDAKHHAGSEQRAVAAGSFESSSLQLAEVTLIDQGGNERTYPWGVADDGLLVINFGYTRCTSICPMGNAVMAQLQAELGPDAPGKVRLVSVTIDPENDTPEVLRETAESFGASKEWFWLTGEPAVVNRLMRSASLRPGDIEGHDPVFLVGDPRSGRFYRSQSLPAAAELLKVIRSFPK